jgi:hypothetical protein
LENVFEQTEIRISVCLAPGCEDFYSILNLQSLFSKPEHYQKNKVHQNMDSQETCLEHSIFTLSGECLNVRLHKSATVRQCCAVIESEYGHPSENQELYLQLSSIPEIDLTKLNASDPMPCHLNQQLILVIKEPPVPVTGGGTTKPCCGRKCELHVKTGCCWCLDKRKEQTGYMQYVDGVGYVENASRTTGYCQACKLQPCGHKHELPGGKKKKKKTKTRKTKLSLP